LFPELPAQEVKGEPEEMKQTIRAIIECFLIMNYDSRIYDHPQTCIFSLTYRLPHAAGTGVA
jgi:hypothetical protein